jgi:hypothetical protein
VERTQETTGRNLWSEAEENTLIDCLQKRLHRTTISASNIISRDYKPLEVFLPLRDESKIRTKIQTCQKMIAKQMPRDGDQKAKESYERARKILDALQLENEVRSFNINININININLYIFYA